MHLVRWYFCAFLSVFSNIICVMGSLKGRYIQCNIIYMMERLKGHTCIFCNLKFLNCVLEFYANIDVNLEYYMLNVICWICLPILEDEIKFIHRRNFVILGIIIRIPLLKNPALLSQSQVNKCKMVETILWKHHMNLCIFCQS